MKCPSCAALLQGSEARCPQCKLSLQKLDMKFGLVPAHSRFLTDRTGKLPLDEMQQLRDELRLFHKKFPQSLFSILVTELKTGESAAEYAFWIANRAKFGAVDAKLGENFHILLVVDLSHQTAALTVGYGLEPWVSEDDLQSVINDLGQAMRTDGLTSGLRAAIESLTRRLRELSVKARDRKQERAVVDA